MHRNLAHIALRASVLTAAPNAGAANVTWSGAGGADLLWSTPGNWTPSGSPGASDAVRFFDPGAAAAAATINNIVSASKVIQSLTYGQTNGYHNTLINPGMTLTISNTAAANLLLVGTETSVGTGAQQETNTISGVGGNLILSGTGGRVHCHQRRESSAAAAVLPAAPTLMA